jgi:hypothetical protein
LTQRQCAGYFRVELIHDRLRADGGPDGHRGRRS